MNKKQKFILIFMITIIVSVFLWLPRYKIVKFDSEGKNYIRTKSGSPLYKRCKSPAQLDWLRIARLLLPTVIISSILISLLKDKESA